MKIFLTGDTHIPIDVEKFNTRSFPEQKTLTKDDFIIVLGDFGLLWKKDKEYLWWKKWLENKPFTTLWLDGNHENHDWIDSLPVSEWNGGKVHFVSPSIIHLMRGQVFTLNGATFFTYGGALSLDKEIRTPGITWWAREEGNYLEECEAMDNLAEHNFQVDYILTHACPDNLLPVMFPQSQKVPSTTGRFLNHVAETVHYKKWFFGHMHEDKTYKNFQVLFKNIIQL